MVDNKNNRAGKNGVNGRSVKIIGSIIIVAAIGVIVVWLKVVRGSEEAASGLPTFVAKRGPLTISVLPSGTIKPQETIVLRNEVEGRTSIIRLIPEGTMVKASDRPGNPKTEGPCRFHQRPREPCRRAEPGQE